MSRASLKIVLLIPIALLASAVAARSSWNWHLPAGWSPPPVPADNPMSAAKVALGRRLFYDADLSIDGSMACATCHEQHRGFSDGNATHPGVHGEPGRRNVPALANVAWMPSLTWGDPRVRTLEAQLLIPIAGTHPVEMGMNGHEADIADRLGKDACYRRMFQAAFPARRGAIDMTTVADALAAFERTLVSDHAPYDTWRAGNVTALSPLARRGARLFFGRAGCAACHGGPGLSDGAFHAIAAPIPNAADEGLGEITGRASDDGRFRTPGLRNVALSAPYLHDGSARTLADAIAAHRRVAKVSSGDLPALIAFLNGLTDPRFVADARFSLPDRACGKKM